MNNWPHWIIEDTTWPLLWGLLLIGILGLVWFVSRRLLFLVAALAVVGLLIAINVVEVSVVTDREQLENAVVEMAAHVQHNEPDGIIKFVRADNRSFANRIRNQMSRFRFFTCHITGITGIDFEPDERNPQKATVRFAVYGSATYANEMHLPQPGTARVQLEFGKQPDGKWTVEAYGYNASNVTDGSFEMVRE